MSLVCTSISHTPSSCLTVLRHVRNCRSIIIIIIIIIITNETLLDHVTLLYFSYLVYAS